MKVSSKGKYGLRCMVDLAINASKEHVALHQIAERQDISLLYLEQVFSALRKAGLVKSVKGAGGGYSLAKEAKDITIGDILRAIEGSLSIVDEKDLAKTRSENPYERCIVSQVWTRIDSAVAKIVDTITLKDLAEETKTALEESALMWFI